MDNENDNPNNGYPLEPWVDPALEARIVALILGEASDFERSELESLIESQPELKAFHQRIQSTHQSLQHAQAPDQVDAENTWKLPRAKSDALLEKFRSAAEVQAAPEEAPSIEKKRQFKLSPWLGVAAAIVILCLTVLPLARRAAEGESPVASAEVRRELPKEINYLIASTLDSKVSNEEGFAFDRPETTTIVVEADGSEKEITMDSEGGETVSEPRVAFADKNTRRFGSTLHNSEDVSDSRYHWKKPAEPAELADNGKAEPIFKREVLGGARNLRGYDYSEAGDVDNEPPADKLFANLSNDTRDAFTLPRSGQKLSENATSGFFPRSTALATDDYKLSVDPGVTGDWDSGIGQHIDGSYINRPTDGKGESVPYFTGVAKSESIELDSFYQYGKDTDFVLADGEEEKKTTTLASAAQDTPAVADWSGAIDGGFAFVAPDVPTHFELAAETGVAGGALPVTPSLVTGLRSGNAPIKPGTITRFQATTDEMLYKEKQLAVKSAPEQLGWSEEEVPQVAKNSFAKVTPQKPGFSPPQSPILSIPQARKEIGEINIRGNEKTLERVVRREIALPSQKLAEAEGIPTPNKIALIKRQSGSNDLLESLELKAKEDMDGDAPGNGGIGGGGGGGEGESLAKADVERQSIVLGDAVKESATSDQNLSEEDEQSDSSRFAQSESKPDASDSSNILGFIQISGNQVPRLATPVPPTAAPVPDKWAFDGVQAPFTPPGSDVPVGGTSLSDLSSRSSSTFGRNSKGESSIADRELTRRLERSQESNEEISKADKLVAEGDLTAATAKYRSALDKLPAAPMTKEHVEDVEEVERLQRLATGYYDLGRYDNAEKNYIAVLRVDKYNETARKGLEQVELARQQYYKTNPDHMRGKMLSAVDELWEWAVPEDNVANQDQNKIQSRAPLPLPLADGAVVWTDDESSKININTASEGAFWDLPRADPQPQAESSPQLQAESYGYPGHIAGISLSSVLQPPNNDADKAAVKLDPPSSVTGGIALPELELAEHQPAIALRWEDADGYMGKRTWGAHGGVRLFAGEPDAVADNADLLFKFNAAIPSSQSRRIDHVEVDPKWASAKQQLGKWSLQITESKQADRSLKTEPDLSLETLTSAEPYSTFSLNVSDVSFKLAKTALLENNSFPEAAKVRVEEFVNAFDYGDPAPSLNEKIACNIDQAAHPFLQQRNLMRVSMRTAAEGRSASQPLRLTILLDKSGSMERADREESVLRTMQALAKHLGPADKISAIAFARQPRLIADQLGGDRAKELVGLVAATPSEGGTNLDEALKLADTLATRQFDEGAINRIVLITDGAANLGDADPESLKERVIALRQRGIAFDACGVGADGLNDATLEALTRKGDGRYYFLDRPEDADANFVRQLAGSLRPAAKNVKVQVKFNPERVTRYRLAGFEKHRLEKEDFRNDKVDAAEMAAAESGNALYQFEADPAGSGDIGEVFVRFLDTDSGKMIERSWPIPYQKNPARLSEAKPSMQLAASAAFLGEKLKGGPAADPIRLSELTPITNQLRSQNQDPRVQSLIQMIEKVRSLSQ
jgi:Mg-chelatase subunit ChlD